MKYLWIFLIAAFVCLATIILLSRYNQDINSRVDYVEPASEPSRIVSLAPNLTEILFALGLGERTAAVSSDSDYPTGVESKNKVGTFWSPDAESIIASRPDLVLALWFEQQKSVADSLKRLGYEVLILKIEKVGELFTAIEKIGVATGCKQRANELVKNIGQQLDDFQQQLASAKKVRVLWVIQVEPLRVAGRNTFINELIELAGGENAIGPTIAKYPQIGEEEVLASGVEIIIQSAMGAGDIPAQQQAAEKFWGRWRNLPAVKNKRIHVVNPDTILRLGPRLPEGIELVAGYLHPDIFAQND